MKFLGLVALMLAATTQAYAADVCQAGVRPNATDVSCTGTITFNVPQNGNYIDVIKAFESNGYQLRAQDSLAFFIFVKN